MRSEISDLHSILLRLKRFHAHMFTAAKHIITRYHERKAMLFANNPEHTIPRTNSFHNPIVFCYACNLLYCSIEKFYGILPCNPGWEIQRQGCSADTVKNKDVPDGKGGDHERDT